MPIRLPSQPLESAEAVQFRRDSSDQKRDYERTLGGARRSAISDRAAVVHFGSQALGLARSQPPPLDPGLDESDDAGDADDAPASTPSPSSAAASEDSTAEAGNATESASSGDDQRQLEAMKRRDREVRTHEQAHKASGGSFAGSVRLTYQMGPDGKRYAVEGEVPIDVSPVAGDPAATLRKMEVVARAARAPAHPSSADQAVAAQAARAMQQARAQLAAERYTRTRELVPG